MDTRRSDTISYMGTPSHAFSLHYTTGMLFREFIEKLHNLLRFSEYFVNFLKIHTLSENDLT